jgi:hypothetical protein
LYQAYELLETFKSVHCQQTANLLSADFFPPKQEKRAN